MQVLLRGPHREPVFGGFAGIFPCRREPEAAAAPSASRPAAPRAVIGDGGAARARTRARGGSCLAGWRETAIEVLRARAREAAGRGETRSSCCARACARRASVGPR